TQAHGAALRPCARRPDQVAETFRLRPGIVAACRALRAKRPPERLCHTHLFRRCLDPPPRRMHRGRAHRSWACLAGPLKTAAPGSRARGGFLILRPPPYHGLMARAEVGGL